MTEKKGCEIEKNYHSTNLTETDKKVIVGDFLAQMEGFTQRIKKNVSDNLENQK